jgi:hypothetical protein
MPESERLKWRAKTVPLSRHPCGSVESGCRRLRRNRRYVLFQREIQLLAMLADFSAAGLATCFEERLSVCLQYTLYDAVAFRFTPLASPDGAA